MNDNIVWHLHSVTKKNRSRQKKQRPCILWFTGLSGAGKSTIASAVEQKLYELGHHTYLLDGDNVRHDLNKDLGFSDRDRIENIRRIGEISKLFVDAGLLVLTAFISPFRRDRRMVRELVGENEFIEIYMATPTKICEQRDPKGLYKKARQGKIKNFTGIDSDYETPEYAEVTINTAELGIEECADVIIDYLKLNQIIFPPEIKI
ncbi:MAG: adenylyl-sulfate kinase [Methylococcales symbiont of Hymedesmia sp. n. MRB-2018]|nr:MAG: adenylyl-sulfate kinase [Methylococcales symbiont of Hymedesmia sp. n. MRB-2018]KAF3983300.1 MAG: adenylyl-sulfate kinase [Methylococcales symbiont of Hymedesmia sp. n. MRB-2018]